MRLSIPGTVSVFSEATIGQVRYSNFSTAKNKETWFLISVLKDCLTLLLPYYCVSFKLIVNITKKIREEESGDGRFLVH